MIIDHVGIVVRSLESGIKQWEEVFDYRKNSEIVLNTRLIEPSEPSSPIFAFARKGGGLHHLGFRCDDIEIELPGLQAKHLRLIVPPEPGEAFGNRPIAFLLADNNLNIELIDTDEKRGWVEES